MVFPTRDRLAGVIGASITFAAALLLLASFPLVEGGSTTRSLPTESLSLPVRVVIDGTGYASGFYLGTRSLVFFVTAKHNLYGDHAPHDLAKAITLLSYPTDPNTTTPYILDLDMRILQSAGHIRTHPTQDVAAVTVATLEGSDPDGELTLVPGVHAKQKAAGGLAYIGVEDTRQLEGVLVGNDVYVLGYPRALGLQQIPQIDYERPLLRKGIVATKNPRTNTIILDCPAYGGNSGGPVLQLEQESVCCRTFAVVGVVLQYVPYVAEHIDRQGGAKGGVLSNSGYSVAASMDPVLELLGGK